MRNTTTQTTTIHAPEVETLQNVLATHIGNGFFHAVTVTVPAMRKTGNPFYGKVWKVTDLHGQAGFHYINSVNNQLEREGKERNADVKPRQWGQRIKGTPLVEHTNKAGVHRLYLEAKCERIASVYYVDAYGVEVDKADLAPWLQARSAKSSTQANVDAEIILRDYALDSIAWIKIDGVELGAKPLAPLPATITV
jgi:hypothetical protein